TEPPSPETSWASNLEKPGCWVASTYPDHSGSDLGASRDAAMGLLDKENALQGFPDESSPPIIRYRCCINTDQASARSFPKNLRKIVSSNHFKSIWWGDDGNCLMITEKLFTEEVLGRRGCLKIFEIERMEGFVLHLNPRGFSKMEGDSLTSASIAELQAVAAAGSALGQVRR
ncbi:HSFY1 protein, partial [Steatornis caripensis]|nr:HSFY1 protein [Steatornis caripensis]